ncbi:MAG TPA: MFS transporter, partial [Dokdonella sp.]
YALLSSMVNLPGKILGFFAGGIAAAAGYRNYFIITVLALVPAAILLAFLWPRMRAQERAEAAGSAETSA